MNSSLSDADTGKVVDILVEQLGVLEEQITPDARIQEDLGADSLDVMEIMMAVEDQFGLSVPDDVAETVSTVGDLCETLATLQGKPASLPR